LAELLDTLRVDGSGIWTGIKGGCDPTSADPYSDFTAYFSKSEIMAAEPKVTPPLTTYPPTPPLTTSILLLLLLHPNHSPSHTYYYYYYISPISISHISISPISISPISIA